MSTGVWTLLIGLLLALLRPSYQANPREDPEHYGLIPVEIYGKKFQVGSVHHDWVLGTEKGCLAVLDRALKDKAGSSCMALDVGMNDGFYTQMSAAYGCKVYSFEMQVPCIVLSRNATFSNGFGHLVNIIHEPVSNKNGVPMRVAHGSDHFQRRCDGGFSIAGDNPNKKAHSPFDVIGYHTFHTIALDSFVQPGAVVDFLKIDVEGHDPEVLAGADALLKSHRIKRLVVEVTVPGWGVSSEVGFGIYKRLFEYGYKTQCVTESPGNRNRAVRAADLSFEQFKDLAPRTCIDWEFYV